MNFVAIDFETACHIPSSACSVGVAKVKSGAVIDSRQWLIRPLHMKFSEYNIAIHKITPEKVEDAPSFAEFWPELRDYIDNNILVAHNANFDMNVFYHSAMSHGIKIPSIKAICSVTLSRAAWKGLKSYRLPELACALNMDLCHHQAKSDAEACAKITLEACRHLGFSSMKECYKCFPAKIGYFNSEIDQPSDDEDQDKRKIASRNLVVTSINENASSGIINGYEVTMTSCNCQDFKRRQMPCKHMYRLIAELENPSSVEIDNRQLIEPSDFILFQSKEELECFVDIFEFPKQRVANNIFVYKGLCTNHPVECTIVGHKHNQTLVIEFKNSSAQRHCINGFYLKDMQSSRFNLKELHGETSEH